MPREGRAARAGHAVPAAARANALQAWEGCGHVCCSWDGLQVGLRLLDHKM